MADFYTEIFPAEDGDITINVYHGTRDNGFRRLMTGGDGDNLIEAGGYFNTLIGGAGADTLTTRFSYVTLEGGEGDDYILIDNSGSTNENISHVVLTGGAGKDTFAFMPGEHTINATITDFDPAEDSLVLVSLTADGSLAVLQALAADIGINENLDMFSYALARSAEESIERDVPEGLIYDSDTRAAALNLPYMGFNLTFNGIEDFDQLSQAYITIVDSEGTSIGSRKTHITLPSGLSIYHSDYYDEDWIFVSSWYKGDVYLGGVDPSGNVGMGWSDTTITDIRADNDTVSGRMLAGFCGQWRRVDVGRCRRLRLFDRRGGSRYLHRRHEQRRGLYQYHQRRLERYRLPLEYQLVQFIPQRSRFKDISRRVQREL